MTLTRRTKLIAAAAALPVAFGVAMAMAAPPSTNFANVPSANTKSHGYAPATMLSPELAQIAGRPGLDEGSRTRPRRRPYYGYDNDIAEPAGQPVMVASTATGNTEAHKTEPDKNTYLVLRPRPEGRRPGLRLRHALPLPGPRGAATPGYITRINLDADAAHRVTLLATQDASGARRSRRSTARPGIRGPSACCSRPRTRTRRPTRRRRTIPSTGRRRLGRARPRRLRGHPERLRRQHLDRRGHRRGEQARCHDARKRSPNSFVYRYVPQRARRPRATASSRCCRS